MATEIERKFLVKGPYKDLACKHLYIKQGYISSQPGRSVRIRIKGDKGYLTIKGKTNESGTSRFEWEKEIPISEAEQLLLLCEKGIINKTRFEVKIGNHIYEVDEFYDENEGLVIAEIELSTEDESFVKPDWLGNEVTTDKRYYNSYLSANPFKSW